MTCEKGLDASALAYADARVISSEIGGGVRLLDLKTATQYRLEASGVEIWRRLQTPVSVAQLAAALQTQYRISAERSFADVMALLNTLRAANLIVIGDRADQTFPPAQSHHDAVSSAVPGSTRAGVEDDRFAERRSPVAVVQHLARAYLDSRPPDAWPEAEDIAAAWMLLQQNRLCSLVAGGDGPGPLSDRLDAYREAVWSVNAPVLATLHRLAPTLQASGIPHVFYKGPVGQLHVYGDPFFRPSTDLDVLVSPAEYEIAKALLEKDGFAVDPGCRSLWWRRFLGEQHFDPPCATLAVIDLHSRLQQPGAPLLRLTTSFLTETLTSEVAGVRLPAPSPIMAILISAMTLVKGLLHHEAVGCHVLDLAILFSRLAPHQRSEVRRAAARQGLFKTLALARRAAGLFAGATPLSEIEVAHDPLAHIAAPDLLTLLIDPTSSNAGWPRRSEILFRLCDGLADYPGAAIWAAGSRLIRLAHDAGAF